MSISRRNFLRFSALGASALMVPDAVKAITPAAKKSKKGSANDIINLGFIGLGQQAIYLMNGFITMPDVRIVAACDIYDIKRNRFEQRVNKYYADKKIKNKLTMYIRYEDLLAREDIDAVVIATPDHQHALMAIAACRAGKDIYLEKPVTFTIYEGQQLIKAVRENTRIVQVGSMQRSMKEFIHAANVVREGRLGKGSLIKAFVGDGPKPYDLPKQEVPAGLDWDLWLGPLSEKFYYNHQLNPLLSEHGHDECWGAWRWYQGMGGGFTTDWGAHMFDVAQWCIGKDGSGPSEILPPSASPYDCLTFRYDNGIEVAQMNFGHGQAVKVYGENGWIIVGRGKYLASSPDLMPTKVDEQRVYETNVPHYQSFIDSVRSRRDPSVPIETGHSSCVMCTLGNIAYELDRPLQWNPIVEKFMNNDAEANSKLHYEYRKPYKLE